MTSELKLMLDGVMDGENEGSVFGSKSQNPTLPTLVQVEKAAVIVGPGREKKSFLRMLKRQSVEYLIDVFYTRKILYKQEFLHIVSSTMKNQTAEEKLIASRYFDSIDLLEYVVLKQQRLHRVQPVRGPVV